MFGSAVKHFNQVCPDQDWAPDWPMLLCCLKVWSTMKCRTDKVKKANSKLTRPVLPPHLEDEHNITCSHPPNNPIGNRTPVEWHPFAVVNGQLFLQRDGIRSGQKAPDQTRFFCSEKREKPSWRLGF